MVVDPLLVPPLCRIDRHSLQEQTEVQMIAGGKASGAAFSDDLPLLHHLARFHVDLTHMAVKRNEAGAMIDQDSIAIDAEIPCLNDLSIIGSFDRGVLYHREIESHMILLIYRFAVINVCPAVGEI